MFKEDDLVVYVPKDVDGNVYKAEVGKIKRLCEDGTDAFVMYGYGSTPARTRLSDLVPLSNAWLFKNNDIGGADREGKE